MLPVAMMTILSKMAVSDAGLLRLLGRAQDYAEIYLLAKERQKGCDGLGETANLRDELKSVIDEVMDYCKEKQYLSDVAAFDIDVIANDLAGIEKE
jgi:SOS response regulatory protein OraA/RecX